MATISVNSRPGGFVSGSSKPTLWARLRRITQYRRILGLLVARDLKVRYAGSALGYLWTVLEPLLMSLVYWFVFAKIFHRNAGPGFDPFMLYLVAGQLAWAWFNGGISGVTRALRDEAQMVRSSNVPRELWVLRVVASKGTEYLFGLPVLALYALAYMKAPTKDIVFLPLAWIMQAVLITGAGLILAPAAVLFKDLERIVPIVLRVLFYASPVLYSINSVPKSVRFVYTFNPAVGFLTLTHAAFFPAALHQPVHKWRRNPDGSLVRVPTLDSHGHQVYDKLGRPLTHRVAYVDHYISHWNWVVNSAIASVAILVIGVFVFVRLERAVLKEI